MCKRSCQAAVPVPFGFLLIHHTGICGQSSQPMIPERIKWRQGFWGGQAMPWEVVFATYEASPAVPFGGSHRPLPWHEQPCEWRVGQNHADRRPNRESPHMFWRNWAGEFFPRVAREGREAQWKKLWQRCSEFRSCSKTWKMKSQLFVK